MKPHSPGFPFSAFKKTKPPSKEIDAAFIYLSIDLNMIYTRMPRKRDGTADHELLTRYIRGCLLAYKKNPGMEEPGMQKLLDNLLNEPGIVGSNSDVERDEAMYRGFSIGQKPVPKAPAKQ